MCQSSVSHKENQKLSFNRSIMKLTELRNKMLSARRHVAQKVKEKKKTKSNSKIPTETMLLISTGIATQKGPYLSQYQICNQQNSNKVKYLRSKLC